MRGILGVFFPTIFLTFVQTSIKKIMAKKLYKGTDKKLFGVCSGLGEYFEVDPTIVRVIFLFAFVVFGAGLLLYLILALVMPNPPGA